MLPGLRHFRAQTPALELQELFLQLGFLHLLPPTPPRPQSSSRSDQLAHDPSRSGPSQRFLPFHRSARSPAVRLEPQNRTPNPAPNRKLPGSAARKSSARQLGAPSLARESRVAGFGSPTLPSSPLRSRIPRAGCQTNWKKNDKGNARGQSPRPKRSRAKPLRDARLFGYTSRARSETAPSFCGAS